MTVSQEARGTVLEPRSTDDEASAILDELSRLQTWCIMQARREPGASAAADLVQRTRILIIERCKRPSALTAEAIRSLKEKPNG